MTSNIPRAVLSNRLRLVQQQLNRSAFMADKRGVPLSCLQLVRGVDGFPYQIHEPDAYKSFTNPYYKFKIHGFEADFGMISERIVHGFRWPECWTVEQSARTLTLSKGSNTAERSELFAQAMQSMTEGSNPVLTKLRGELLPTFGPTGENVVNIDRAASLMFGTVMYGVQMLAYVKTERGLRYWVPRRAKSRKSYPGMLDNCVGGALNSGATPLTCLVREAHEEAALPEAYVRENAKPYGVLSYHMATDGNGKEGHQPQVMYVYHIELTPDVVPKPLDGEVEKFEQMTLDEIRTALRNGEFKTNCSLAWIAYLISVGVINAENEENLCSIMSHMHRRLDFPTK